MKVEEPALAVDPVERRVPPDCLAHVGDRADDKRVEAAADVAPPARHSRDVSLHGDAAVRLRVLGAAAWEEGWLRIAGHCVCSSVSVSSCAECVGQYRNGPAEIEA